MAFTTTKVVSQCPKTVFFSIKNHLYLIYQVQVILYIVFILRLFLKVHHKLPALLPQIQYRKFADFLYSISYEYDVTAVLG